MIRRWAILLILVAVWAASNACCHNDQKVIDKHEQALDEEEE